MNQHVLVVGASDGIGLHVATILHQLGARVTTACRRPCPLDGVLHIPTDVSLYGERQNLIERIKAADAPIDAMVYLAGTSLAAPIEATTDADYRYLWEVNYFGFVHLTAGLLALLRQAAGRVVAVSSMAAVAPIPFDAHYSASKSALVTFCNALQCEVAPYGVKVSAVLPGGVQTAFSYKRKIYDQTQCGDYAHAVVDAACQLERIEQHGADPQQVAREIVALLSRPYPPPVLPTGIGNRALYCLCKHLPTSCKRALIEEVYLHK